MVNFKNEIFPKINIISDFDKKINSIEKSIVKNKTIQEVLENNQEIIPKKAGTYFFYDTKEKKIVYVGISRKIKSRLQQHTNHKSSNSASLAYLMAKKEFADKKAWTKTKDWDKTKGYWGKLKEEFENNNNYRNKYQDKINRVMMI